MKKKVRIYKAPDGQGKVINKLSSFIQKAQEGGMPDPDAMGYPQETAAPSEDQISQMIISDISNGRPKEETVFKIANSSGLDPMSINQYYDQLYEALEQEQEQAIAANEEEDEEEVVQPEVEEQVIEEDFYGGDYNNDMSNDIVAEDEEEDYSDEDAFASDLVMKFGGSYKKAKNAFVKQKVSLVKKQAGGDEPTKNSDTDPIGEDFRKNKLQAFIGTVKNESAQAKAKEQAEQEFDQMMQQQQMPEYPMEQPMAQFGMSVDPRMSRKMQRMYKKMPMMGMNPGAISKVDVRRSGLFGRPKEYSVEFGNPSFGAGYAMPGMGAGFYGYGQTTKQQGKTKGRIITEEIAKTVNDASTKEVATNTPGNTATDKPNDATTSTTTPGSTASNVQQNTGADGKRKATQVNDEATDAVVNNSEVTREQNKQKTIQAEGLYTYPGTKALYKKKNNTWYIDPSGMGSNFQELSKNKSERVKTLESKALPYSGRPSTEPLANIYDAPITFGNEGNKYLDLSTLKVPSNYKAPIQVGSEEFYKLTPARQQQIRKAQFKKNPDNIFASLYYKGLDGTLAGSDGSMWRNGGQTYYNPFGGFVDSENPDLYKFIYGGDDIDQADIDDMYAKDTTDPYFRYGGLTTYEDKGETDENDFSWSGTVSNPDNIVDNYNPRFGSSVNDRYPKKDTDYEARLAQERKKWEQEYMQRQNPYANIGYNGFNAFGSLFPANIATNRGSYAQMRRGPYDRLSGANIPGMGFGPNTQVQSIDVTKSGMFGRPKKYTINYGNQEMDPRKQNLITLPGQGTTPAAQTTGAGRTFSNTEGLGAGSTGAIRRGERRTARELARGEKQNLSASDANLDPYAGFPLDHPIRSQEKLEINSVKDYLKPSQKSPSSLGLSPFVSAPAEQKLDDSNVPNAFKDPIGNALQNEKTAKDKQDQISGKSFKEYGDVSTDLNNPNIQQEYQKIYAEQGPDAASAMMDKQFANRNNAIDTRLADEKMQTQKDYDNTMQQNYMEDQGFGDLYQEPSEQSNTSSTNPYASNADYGLGFEPEADESFDKGYFGNQSIDRYDKYRQQMERQAAANRQPTTNRPVQNNQPVQRASPEEFQRRLDRQINQGNNPNLSKEENVINNTFFNRISDLERQSFEAGKNNNFKLRDSIDKQIKELEKQKQQAKKDLGYNENYGLGAHDINKEIKTHNSYMQHLEKANADEAKRLKESQQLAGAKQWFNHPSIKIIANQLNPFKQFGGDLSRFTGGGTSPVTYTDNKALIGMSNVDMLTLNEGIPGLQPSNFWNEQASFNDAVPVNTQKQPEEIKMDKAQLSSDQAKKAYQATPGKFSMDFKTKNMWEVDPEGSLAVLNAGVRGATGMINRFRDKDREAKMYENLTADNLYASDPSRDRGDYETNTGLYRPDEQGQVWNSRSAQYGGSMEDYYEGDEVDMTEEELADFIANGGEVEYL